MQNSKTAVVVGATGLIGSELVQILINSQHYHKITVLTRRKLDIEHVKLDIQIVDFENIINSKFEADDAFCCLGTTRKKAGSKANFYKVDFTYIHNFAKTAFQNGAKQFLMVSAMEANSKSIFYYNQVKGEAEEAIQDIGFQGIKILQPSMLMGNRSDKRLGEELGKVVFKFFGSIIPKKYQGIESQQVAKTMTKVAIENQDGILFLESDKIQEY